MLVAYYLTATGQILLTKFWPDTTPSSVYDDLVGVGMAYAVDPLEEVSVLTHYYPAGVKTARPQIYSETDVVIDADGIINISFVLPNGTDVDSPLDNLTYTSAGGESFQFKTARLGEWEFGFTGPWPYQPLTLRITANAF